MSRAFVVAASRTVDGRTDVDTFTAALPRLEAAGVSPVRLIIDPLRVPWDAPDQAGHFRTGCAAIQALVAARKLIEESAAAAVIIEGDDPLRSGYGRDERHALMAIYGPEYPLPEAYTDVAGAFMERHGLSDADFRRLLDQLLANFQRTWSGPAPAERWRQPITELFRGVDCANPLIDFSGRLLVCEGSLAAKLVPGDQRAVRIAGTGLGFTEDGREHAASIASYEHLTSACQAACQEAGLDLAGEFRAGQLLLEAYTCYPVVPLGFLLATGIASAAADLSDILTHHEITVTGGMNLARAPWSCAALNAAITVFEQLRRGSHPWGAVHGNGGMGYVQGLAILNAD